MRGPFVALAFLTVVPVGRLAAADSLGASLPWFPAVGAGIGAAAGGVYAGLRSVTGGGPAAVGALLTVLILTGALHADGLADSADALGVRGGRQRRLEVMRESTLGTFGALALLVWGLGIFAAVPRMSGAHAVRTLIAAEALARLAALLHGRLTGPARPDGLGAGFRVPVPALIAAAVLTVALGVLSLGPRMAAIGLGCVLVVGVATAGAALRGLGGRTGDTLGATVALTELVAVVALSSAW